MTAQHLSSCSFELLLQAIGIKLDDLNNPQRDLKSIRIEDLGLSQRAFNCLRRAGIKTAHDLGSTTKDELKAIRGMGRMQIDEIELALIKRAGVCLALEYKGPPDEQSDDE